MEEIEKLVLEHHAAVPRHRAKSIGTIYARFSTRFQDSIEDQVRTILAEATSLRIHVPREYVFFDMAVRGVFNRRAGLNDIREVLSAKKVDVLLLFSTSRLFRKQYRTLAFVDQVHRGYDVRCIFVKSGIDTNDTQRWETLLATQAMIDQFSVAMNVSNIRAAHEGLLTKQIVFGSLSFGYGGEPIPGEFTRRNLPRRRIVVDEVSAEVVRRIYHWYVVDKLSISAIVQRLNSHRDWPRPERLTSELWTRLAVKRILTNPRYRGLWQYGVTEAVYVPDGDYIRKRMRSTPLKELQIEELRIVSEELWFAAQQRLLSRSNNGPRRKEGGVISSGPHVLNGLFYCPEHDQPLYVGGSNAKMFFCPQCRQLPREERPLYSELNRELAFEMICTTLAKFVEQDDALVDEVVHACQEMAQSAQRPDASRLAALRKEHDQFQRSIRFAMANVGETDEEQELTQATVQELRRSSAMTTSEIARLEAANKRVPKVPSPMEVRAITSQLRSVLQAASQSTDDEEQTALRNVISSLTGSRIDVYQCGERKAKRGWLRGTFRAKLFSYLVETASEIPDADVHDGALVEVEFRPPVPYDAQAECAWDLYTKKLLGKEIAAELNCGKSQVTKLLKYAAQKHGAEYVDGRSRRHQLENKDSDPPLFRRIADVAKSLWDSGMLVFEIARELNCNQATVTKAIAYWHTSRELPAPDGRVRRKSLVRKASKPRSKPKKQD